MGDQRVQISYVRHGQGVTVSYFKYRIKEYWYLIYCNTGSMSKGTYHEIQDQKVKVSYKIQDQEVKASDIVRIKK